MLGFPVSSAFREFVACMKHHEKKIEKYANQIVGPEDTLVSGDYLNFHPERVRSVHYSAEKN